MTPELSIDVIMGGQNLESTPHMKLLQAQKIGTQCVHVASQKKRYDRMFIKQNETSSCNYLFLTMPTMQLLDLKFND